MTQDIEVRNETAALFLNLNRPDALNALTSQMLDTLLAAVLEAATRTDVRSIVLGGNGEKGFCSGIDLAQRQQLDPVEKGRQSQRVVELVQALRSSPKPTIAMLHGFCLGAGLEVALACDVRIAADNAKLGFPEMTLGAYPGGGGAVLLPRLIGRARAIAWLLSGKRMSATDAAQAGLVAQVVGPEQLNEAVADMVASISKMAPLAVTALKTSIDTTLDLPFDEAIIADQGLRRPLDATRDYQEALLAFKEKRTPVFTGQ
jgi:enoyl-CoA hydratase/carnithine racemase